MELKQSISKESEGIKRLLIVPYGIETSEKIPETEEDILLIVPYGIETI